MIIRSVNRSFFYLSKKIRS